MSTDYIKREEAIEAIWKPEVRPNDLIFDALRRACEEEVKHVPVADVVEVVRCKDCIHADDRDCPIDWPKNEEDYCSFGERRANP